MFEVIFFSLIGGVFSLIGGILLISRKATAEGLAKYATPFAAGVLLGAAFVDLLPEALHDAANASAVLQWSLLGVLGFFILERFLHFFHHHHEHEQKGKTSNLLIIVGDTLHNALDGVAIGAAFLISVPTGIVTTIAVATHEIPQEIGDFGLMLKNGMSRRKVVMVNVASALATTATAVATFVIGDSVEGLVSPLLALTAGFFIYIAASDIIPELHDEIGRKLADIRPWLLVLGAVVVMVFSPIAHAYIESDTHEESSIDHTTEQVHNESVCTSADQVGSSSTYTACSDKIQ